MQQRKVPVLAAAQSASASCPEVQKCRAQLVSLLVGRVKIRSVEAAAWEFLEAQGEGGGPLSFVESVSFARACGVKRESIQRESTHD